MIYRIEKDRRKKKFFNHPRFYTYYFYKRITVEIAAVTSLYLCKAILRAK